MVKWFNLNIGKISFGFSLKNVGVFCQRPYLCPLHVLENNDYDVKSCLKLFPPLRLSLCFSLSISLSFSLSSLLLSIFLSFCSLIQFSLRKIRVFDIDNTTACAVVNTHAHSFARDLKPNEYQVEQSQASMLNSVKN